MHHICVVGTGYVGLVVGACFADMGNQVICVDNNQAKIENLKKGHIPIYEPGLEEIVVHNHQDGRLSFTTELDQAVKKSLICFIAVGTPPGEDGSADLKHVLAVAKGIAQAADGYKIVINKSTVPIGTADKVRAVLAQYSQEPFDVVSNPEFLKEGSAVADFMRPARIIIGTDSPRAENEIKELYEPFNRTGKPILVMSNRSAEMAKYAANAMLATRISFMNEIANVCERTGADIDDIRQALASDPRIGKKFLFAGVGYGGSCFPKDVKALLKTAEENTYLMAVLKAVEEVNDRQKAVLLEKVRTHFNNDLSGKNIAIWGLAFKANTDDMREAPARVVINGLLADGAHITAYDPAAMAAARDLFADKIQYAENSYDAVQGADALLVLTEWNEFRYPDFQRVKDSMQSAVIFDGRNLYNQEMLADYNYDAYYSIGRS